MGAAVKIDTDKLNAIWERCSAYGAFLGVLLVSTPPISRVAFRQLDLMEPDALAGYPAMIRQPVFARGALEAAEHVTQQYVRTGGKVALPATMAMAARRLLSDGGKPLTTSETIDFDPKRFLNHRREIDDKLGYASAWMVCAANATACVRMGKYYIPLGLTEPFDARSGGFVGAATAATAFERIHQAALTEGGRISVANMLARVLSDAVVPPVRK